MPLTHYIAWFFGAVFLTNAVPHLVAGVLGRAFQSPFAKPPGQGRSSSVVNVLWGFANLVVAWLLLVHVEGFELRVPAHALVAAAGALPMALFSAWGFGRFNGGNTPLVPRR